MSIRRPSKSDATTPDAAPVRPAAQPVATPSPTPIAAPRSLEEAEARYVVARDAWTAAMRKANSGRSADLASLALRQETFELASAELERWRSGVTISIPIEPEAKRAGLEAAISQEMAWRRVHEQHEKQPGRLSRLARRLTGRG
jgi:hypothetical protein